MAEETDWTPQQIAENTGMSYRTVMRYLPDKYKNREMQELREKRVVASLATEEKEPSVQSKPEAVSEIEKEGIEATTDEKAEAIVEVKEDVRPAEEGLPPILNETPGKGGPRKPRAVDTR